MGKKKKIFKQKIKQMLDGLKQEEKESISSKPVLYEGGDAKKETILKKKIKEVDNSLVQITLADIKKTAVIFCLIFLFILAVSVLFKKTSFVTLFTDKIYNWAKLGD